MYSKMQSIHTPLTPELCKEHAELPQIKGDRGMKATRSAYLKDRFNRGLFHDPEWAVVYYKGKKFRINGKHSANMLMSLNGSFPKDMHVTIKQFCADTEIDMALLFEQFDARESVRTVLDCGTVHSSLHDELGSVARSTIQRVVDGVVWYLKETDGQSFTSEDKRQLIHSHCQFIAWVDQFTGPNRMKRIGIIAAMFSTYQINQQKALAFWTLVREQNHEDSNNPTRVFGRFLELSDLSPIDKTRRIKWEQRAYYSKAIHAWNAWIDGHTTSLKYHPNAPLPEPSVP